MTTITTDGGQFAEPNMNNSDIEVVSSTPLEGTPLYDATESDRVIVGLVALPCGGKSTVVDLMNMMGVQSTSMGDVVRSVAQELDTTPWKAARQLRSKSDTEIARRTRGAVSSALADDGIVAVDGLRSPQEMQYYEDSFAEANFVLVEVWCDHSTRLQRYMDRSGEDFSTALDALSRRDERELEVGMGELFDTVHTTIYNDYSVSYTDLCGQVERLLENFSNGGQQ